MKILIVGPESERSNRICALLEGSYPGVELVYERDLPKPVSNGLQSEGYWLDELASTDKLPKRRK